MADTYAVLVPAGGEETGHVPTGEEFKSHDAALERAKELAREQLPMATVAIEHVGSADPRTTVQYRPEGQTPVVEVVDGEVKVTRWDPVGDVEYRITNGTETTDLEAE